MNAAELRRLLQRHGLAPTKRRGQNFLVDDAMLAAIPRDASVQAGDRVLEVGPGAGALTAELLQAGATVFAVELDFGLARLLRERFASELERCRLHLVEGDALASAERFHERVEQWWSEGPPPRLVSNLPYAISGPFLSRLPGRTLLGATLLLQREVAEKALSGAAGGPLGVRLQLAFHGRLGRRVPPQVFWPPPKVASAFLHLEPREDAPDAELDRALTAMLRLGFQQRRKRVLPRLTEAFPVAAAALQRAGLDADARAEQVPVELWLAAARDVIIRGS